MLVNKHMDQLQFHDELNPTMWRGDRLRLEVRLKTFQSAIAFYRFLDVPKLLVRDIILTGSMAAYNYTPLSDLDVHLIVDFSHSTCPELADKFFTTKKALWSKTFNVSIHGHPLELYVEDAADPVKASGIYSILHNRWIKHPSPTAPASDDSAVQQKVEAYVAQINDLLAGQPTVKTVNGLLRRLHILRSNGLLTGGEFSTENLTYKLLRNAGYLQKLYDNWVELRDAELSL